MATSSASFMEHFNYSPIDEHSNEDHEHFDKLKAKKMSASKLLFAEDLVGYIAKNFYGISYEETKLQKCRDLLHVALNETVKKAVTFIRNHLGTKCKLSFEVFCNLSESAKDFYQEFVKAVLDDNDACRYDVGLFLYYCVYFADLASRCYTKEIPEILEYAVYSILDSFSKFDLCKWSDLENLAEKILTYSHYHDISASIDEKQTTNKSEIYKECVERIFDMIYQVHPDVYEEIKMKFSDSFPSEDTFTFPIGDKSLNNDYCDKTDSIELISENIREPSYMKSELKQNTSMISLSEDDVAYLSNLPTAVETVASSKALIVAVALLNYEDSAEDSCDGNIAQSSVRESPEMNETVIKSPVNLKESQLEQMDYLSESVKPDEQSARSSVLKTKISGVETLKITVTDDETRDYIICCDPQCSVNPGDLIFLEADRLYFAEELVACIAKFHNIQHTKDGENPETFKNPFSETVRAAVHFIFWQIHNVDVLTFKTKLPIVYDEPSLRKFFTGILSHYPEGLNAGLFLYYSVYVSNIAFSRSKLDSSQALYLAVCFILESFCMLTEGWDDLYNISKKIVMLSNIRELYPGYTKGLDFSIPSGTKMLDGTLYEKSDDEDPKMDLEIELKSGENKCSKDESTVLHRNIIYVPIVNSQTNDSLEISEGNKVRTGLHDSCASSSSFANFAKLEKIPDSLSNDDISSLLSMSLKASELVRNKGSIFLHLLSSRDNKDEEMASPWPEMTTKLYKRRHIDAHLREFSPVDKERNAETFASQGKILQHCHCSENNNNKENIAGPLLNV